MKSVRGKKLLPFTSLAFSICLCAQYGLPEGAWASNAAKKMDAANVALFNGDTDGAIRFIKQAIQMEPDFIDARKALVNLYAQKEDYDAAIAECRKVLEMRPKYQQGHLELGSLLKVYGEKVAKDDKEKSELLLKEAKEQLELAAQNNVQPHLTHSALATMKLQSGDIEGSHVHIQKCLDAKDRFPEAHLLHSIVLFRKGGDRDVSALNKEKSATEKEKSGGNSEEIAKLKEESTALKAEALSLKNQALTELDVAIKQKGKYPEAHNAKGDMLASMGRIPEAEAEYRKAIKDDPKFAQGYVSLGNIMFNKVKEKSKGDKLDSSLPEYKECLDYFKKATELNPSDKNAWYGKAILYEKVGDFENAIWAFEKALEVENDNNMSMQIRMHINQLRQQRGFNINMPGAGSGNMPGLGMPGVGQPFKMDYKNLIKQQGPAMDRSKKEKPAK